MPAPSQLRAAPRSPALVAPDALQAPGQSAAGAQMQHLLAAGALIAAFAVVTIFIVRALAAG